MATSFCTNFHKWGLVNFDCSTLWVRDRTLLTEALDITPPFLRSKEGDSGLVIDYRNWHLALGRRFRSLKLWFVFRSYGVEGFRNYIKRCINMNTSFQNRLSETQLLELVTTPSLSLSVFRIPPSALTTSTTSSSSSQLQPDVDKSPKPKLETMNDLNQSFYSRLSSRNDILLTQTVLNGVFCIRLAIGAERTRSHDIDRAYEILVEEAERTVEEWKAKNVPVRSHM